MRIYYSARDRTPDLLNQRQTCYHLSQCVGRRNSNGDFFEEKSRVERFSLKTFSSIESLMDFIENSHVTFIWNHIFDCTQRTSELCADPGRRDMGNACYYSLEKILSSLLLSKKLKVKTYKTINSPIVLYGCETWSLTLKEEHRLRMFENKVLRKIQYLGLRKKKLQENGESYIILSYIYLLCILRLT